MEYNLYFDYAAIGILLFCLYFLITRKDMRNKENKVLTVLVGMSMVALIGDIVAVYVQNDFAHHSIAEGYFWNYWYLIAHTMSPMVLIVYIVFLLGIEERVTTGSWTLLATPSVIVLIILALNPFFDLYFYYNEEMIYSYGPLTPVVVGLPLLQMLTGIYLVIRYRKRMRRSMFTAMMTFFVLTVFSLVYQFFHKGLLIELYFNALSLLGVMLALENKDEINALVQANDALMAERERADKANQSKSDFLANMSHEIRTPINAVLGMDEMIIRDVSEGRYDGVRLYAENIKNAGNNLLSIVNDILDFSKIESGKMELVETEYQLGNLLNDVCNMAEFRARAKNLAFEVYVDESLPARLYGDEVRVRQILTNILGNAVKYTKEGSVKLKLRGDIERWDRVNLKFTVTDTGIGIREEDLSRLFKKFERVDLGHNNTIEGTGLGLSITKNLLEMMNGTIRVESTYGEGSTFIVTIPQQITDDNALGNFRDAFAKNVREKTGYHESFTAPDARILVVDDTAMNLTVIKGLLRKTKIQVDTATSGAKALEMTMADAYDLILMDQRMPEMDGTETLHAIRAQQDGRNKEVPVICLTADALQGAREHYLAEGFSDYLSKPVDGVQLERMLQDYLPPEKLQGSGEIIEKTSDTIDTASGEAPAPISEPAPDTSALSGDELKRDVEQRTKALLAEYRAMREVIGAMIGASGTDENADADERDEIDIEELQEVYDGILEFAEMYDIDSIDRLFKQTSDYRIPQSEEERYQKVKRAIRDSDWEGLKNVIKG